MVFWFGCNFSFLFFYLPGLAVAVQGLLWSEMAPSSPLPRLSPLPHPLCDDADPPPAFTAW